MPPVAVPEPGPGIRGPATPTTAPRRAPETKDTEYVVWYGTNRRPLDPRDSGKGYSAIRDLPGTVHYGSCRVFIPKSHKIGSTGSPWWKWLLTWTHDRLRLLSVDEVERTAYWSGIAAHLAAIGVDERSALIFVHGYNVSFRRGGTACGADWIRPVCQRGDGVLQLAVAGIDRRLSRR
jgi:esterase/lipase superfamily enzyme